MRISKNIVLTLSLIYLFACCADRNVYNDLECASLDGDLKGIQEAIDNGADLNALKYQEAKNSIIFEIISDASLCKNPSEVLTYLISKGSNVNIVNAEGQTPLMYCFSNLNKYTFKIISILLDAGANVNVQDKYGNTALILFSSLWYGEEKEQYAILKALVNNGAEVNIKDNEGRTALSYLTMGTEHVEAVKILLESGADVNVKDIEGKTPLMNAYHEDETAALLRKCGAVEPDNESFLFFLELDKKQTDYKKIEKYLERLSVNEKDIYCGYTPLITAINNDNINLLRFLLDKGADINMKQGISDSTPLMLFIYNFRYNKEMEVKMDLLGILLNRKDLKINEIGGCCLNDTALDIAMHVKMENKTLNHIEKVIDELRKHGAKTYDELIQDYDF